MRRKKMGRKEFRGFVFPLFESVEKLKKGDYIGLFFRGR